FYYDTPGWDDRYIEAKVDEALRGGCNVPNWDHYPLPRPYNGVTGQERRTLSTKFYIAREQGLIPWCRRCTICLSNERVGAHNELYLRPCNARPICSRCHRILHRRFYDPNPW